MVDRARLRRRAMASRLNVDALLRRLCAQTPGGLWLEYVGAIPRLCADAPRERPARPAPRLAGRPRYGPRRILVIGTLIFAVGFFIFSLVESVTTYFVAFILIALGSSLGGFAFLMVSIVSWFDAHRAKAVAMSQIGFSAGELCVPFVMMGLATFGWRSMALYSGVLILVVGLPLVSLVRHRPEDYGEVPDGIRAQDDGDESSSSTDTQISLSWRQAVKEPSFWLVSSGHALSLLTVSSMLAHLIPYLTFDLGYEPVTAGFVFALMTALQMKGLFLGGAIGDHLDKRTTCTLCMLGHFVGLIVLTHGVDPILVIAFAVAHGLAWGVRSAYGRLARRLLWPEIFRYYYGYLFPHSDDGHDPRPTVFRHLV
jgi:sugar phosphate permease